MKFWTTVTFPYFAPLQSSTCKRSASQTWRWRGLRNVLFYSKPSNSRAGPKHQDTLKVFIPKSLKLDCLPGHFFRMLSVVLLQLPDRDVGHLTPDGHHLLLNEPIATATGQPALNTDHSCVHRILLKLLLSSTKGPQWLFTAHGIWKALRIISPGPSPPRWALLPTSSVSSSLANTLGQQNLLCYLPPLTSVFCWSRSDEVLMCGLVPHLSAKIVSNGQLFLVHLQSCQT